MKRIQPSSYILPVSWLIISTILLTLPGTAFPKENWLDKIWADKWIHITMFGLLTFLWCRAFRTINEEKLKVRKVFIQVAVISLVFGIAMEFVQKYWIPFRSFDIGDIIADGSGSAIGLLISLRAYIKK